MSADEVQAMEPHVKLNIQGAVLFKCDAHLYPQKLMSSLINWLKRNDVELRPNEEVIRIEKSKGEIKKVVTSKGGNEADLVVMATGSWSREVASIMDLYLPLVPGRGYSVTLENSPFKLNHPAILVEGRVAITPMDGNKIRFGGTMEITNTNRPPQMSRVQGILNSVKKFIPEFEINMPDKKDVWYGYRPCSPDGLPYIGKVKGIENLIVATGHAMIGLSLGAGTGKMVAELANNQNTSMDLTPFAVNRFQ
jgi:D-amino-acid dehydrogenase